MSRLYETQVINKNITTEIEYDIKIRSSKLATTKRNGYTKPELKILMDYILKMDDEQITLLKPGSIFIDEITHDTDKPKSDSHSDSQFNQKGISTPGYSIMYIYQQTKY